MAKYQGVIPYSMDEAIRFLDQCITGGSRPAVLRESADVRDGEMRCCVRLYERFDFPAADQSCLCLVLADEGDRTQVTSMIIGTGRLTYFGREERTDIWKEPYFLSLMKDILAKFNVKEAG